MGYVSYQLTLLQNVTEIYWEPLKISCWQKDISNYITSVQPHWLSVTEQSILIIVAAKAISEMANMSFVSYGGLTQFIQVQMA